MMRLILCRTLIGACVFTSLRLSAQEVRFSQYNAAPLQLNPASAGTAESPTLGLNYRVQQLGILAYKTGYFSAMLPFSGGSDGQGTLPWGGLGVGLLSDLAGEQNELRTMQFDLSGSYNLPLNRPRTHFLTFGLQASYQQTNVNYGRLTWPSQITYRGFEGPSPQVGYETGVSALRFNSGLIWTYDPMRNPWRKIQRFRLHAGLAMANLNRPDYSYLRDGSSRLSRVLRLHGGGQFYLNRRVHLSPDFLIIRQASLSQYAAGLVLGLHTVPDTAPRLADFSVRIGSWYRYQDAVVVLIGGTHRQVDAALSYDLSASADRTGIPRQHTLELSLRYQFTNHRTPEVLPTPLF